MIKNTTKKTFQEVMNEFKSLETGMQHMVRNTAKLSLKEQEVPEIGSSDVNCEIVSLYNCFGSFDDVVRHGLELCRPWTSINIEQCELPNSTQGFRVIRA